MSKLVKDVITKDLRRRYADLDSALLVEFVGVDGNTNNAFRGELRERQMRLEIVKNSMFRRATGDSKLAPLHRDLQGPSALLTGGESIIDIAKLVHEWRGKIKGLRPKSAVLEGEYVDAEAVERLHKMLTKGEMQARLAGAIMGPARKLAGAINAGGANIAGCLKAMIAKLEKGETIQAA